MIALAPSRATARARPFLVVAGAFLCAAVALTDGAAAAPRAANFEQGGSAAAAPRAANFEQGGSAAAPAFKRLDAQAKLCARPIAEAERAHRIPNQLLAAVAVTESGRWLGSDRAIFAWPWTVTSGPKTWYFETREDAVAQVEALRAKGLGNIDVGCMQVNLRHHGDAFASIAEALDPEANVAYGASFLARLNAERRSWAQAVGFYHSSKPEFQNRYRRKVFKAWNAERRRAAEEHRQAMQARAAAERDARRARRAEIDARRAADVR